MSATKRSQNEREFGNWTERAGGGRAYWFEIRGRAGGFARYVKEVDADEKTLTFRQEIYSPEGVLTEIHEKYPEDKGHQKVSS